MQGQGWGQLGRRLCHNPCSVVTIVPQAMAMAMSQYWGDGTLLEALYGYVLHPATRQRLVSIAMGISLMAGG